MEVHERREYCVLECGEEELDESQKKFYHTKLSDLGKLLQLVDDCQADVGADPSPSKPPSLNLADLLSQPITNNHKPRPLVVLDPATLNQIATSNGYRATDPSANNSTAMPVGGHSLPALAPNFRPTPHRIVTTSAPSSESITLANLLTFGQRQHPQGTRYSAPPPSQAVYNPQTLGMIPQSPGHQIHQSPVCANSPVRVRAPALPISQIRVRPPPPTYADSHVRNMAPSFNNNGFTPNSGPRARIPTPGQPATQLLPPPLPKDQAVQNSPSAIDGMHRNFNKCSEYPEPHGQCGIGTKSTTVAPLPPPDLPLLPETRPETASDSRPRPRPGPASRTQRLPSIPSSPDSHTSSEMVDLTQDDQPPSTCKRTSTREKTFPSLIVTARASLKIIPTILVNNERLLMDNQIRKVMQMLPAVFTEYLLQQRLLKSEQFCKEHDTPLKLGIYSDPKRFPVSGGYVWIADCCKSGFCSVYSGSIFDKTLQPPASIIKLMYHWCCNTAVHNVLNWVKVDSYIMKTYYTFFRAVCTTVVHQKSGLLGGSSKKIQVGVISIGTHPDGASKEVKVDIMAVMDPDTNAIRLKVLENFLSDSNKVYESKFRKILEVLKDWVHPQSTIVTDFTVDLALGREYGFSSFIVSGGKHSADNNCAVMDYMRAKLPLMFQNTLGLLSYTIIQQFLDELVWRETWGPYPSRAYESLVGHLAELTKLPGPDLISKLKSIASEPLKDWKYSVWKDDSPKRSRSLKAAEQVPADIKNGASSSDGLKNRSSSAEQVNNRVLSVDGTKRKVQREVSCFEEIGNRASSTVDSPREMASDSMDRSLNTVDPAVAVPMLMIPQNQQKTSEKKIFLEPFYYGVVDGDPTCQKRSGSFLAECVLCKRDFLSASSFTNHLIHHALNSNVSQISPDQLSNTCTLCCKTVWDVKRHNKENHPYPPHTKQCFMCKICRLDLKSEEKIVKHMTLVHQELDMPYKCDLCRFQTSIYDSAAGHFKDFHDKDYCVRCPYCFKIVRFCSKNGLEISQNQYYFIQHIQKHSVNKLNRKCEKCVLSFTNMATLKHHQERVHKRSGKFLTNVRRLKYDVQKMLIMSFPTQPHLPPVTLHENSFHTLKGKALSSSVVLPEYYAVCSCLECDGPMTQNHFSVKMTCTKCPFQSCCANSIREHSARRHYVVDNPSDQNLRSQVVGGCPFLDKPLYCSYCTFCSKNGNKMAEHLADCGDGGAAATSVKRKLDVFVSPRKALRNS